MNVPRFRPDFIRNLPKTGPERDFAEQLTLLDYLSVHEGLEDIACQVNGELERQIYATKDELSRELGYMTLEQSMRRLVGERHPRGDEFIETLDIFNVTLKALTNREFNWSQYYKTRHEDFTGYLRNSETGFCSGFGQIVYANLYMVFEPSQVIAHQAVSIGQMMNIAIVPV